jgi:hypothetical protein
MTLQLEKKIRDFIPTAEGWCWPQKAITLAEYVLQLQPSIVVEIGVFGGRSLIPIGMALQENYSAGNPYQSVAVGVDPWDRESSLEGDNDPANNEWWANLDIDAIHRGFMALVRKHRLSGFIIPMRCQSGTAAQLFQNGQVGLIHCDGNHSEFSSCRDVNLWWPKLKSGGIWCMDDSNWPSQAKAIQMLYDLGATKELVLTEHQGEATFFSKP